MSASLARVAVLILAAVLRLWRLDQNGFDNEYYAAAVRSMAAGWHAFLYNGFDPAGFVSVDKPPVAFWIQALAVRLFGFHGITVLLPQVVEGVAAVALLDHLVRRRFGTGAGLLAALFLAVMPVSVATDRSNNTESCLVLVLLLAAWALLAAAERGSRRLLWLATGLIGLAFNVKMLAAFVVLPAFALVYVLGAPLSWSRRIGDLTVAGAILVILSLSWILAFDLTPAERRPFAGSTQHNSMAELAVGHNGLGRFVRLSRPSVATAGVTAPPVTPMGRPSGRFARLFVRAPVGLLRLADGQLAAQVGWLLPLALLGAAAGLRVARRMPLAPAHASTLLWSAWALTYAIVFSFAGGIFHYYYLVLLAPPLAALAAIGLRVAWTAERRWLALAVPGALLLTVAWQLYVEGSTIGLALPPGDWRRWLAPTLAVGGLAAVGGLLFLAMAPQTRVRRVMMPACVAAALLALLVTPSAWALSSVLVKGVPILPSADLARLAPGDRVVDARERGRAAWYRGLITFLEDNRHGERYLLATSTTRVAAPIIIATGEPVMAMGGFHGLDPILTEETLADLVATNQVRFAMQGDLSLIDRRMGAETAAGPVRDWIRQHGTLVDPALWWAGAATGDEATAAARRQARVATGLELYDLKPGQEIVPLRPTRSR